MTAFDLSSPAVAALHREFLARCRADGAILDDWLRGGGMQDREPVRFMAHRLAGAAAVFGHPDLSRVAKSLEDAVAGGDATVLNAACRALATVMADLATAH